MQNTCLKKINTIGKYTYFVLKIKRLSHLLALQVVFLNLRNGVYIPISNYVGCCYF